MTRAYWDVVKQSKGFHVRMYRLTGRLLVMSFMIMVLLGFGIVFVKLHEPQPDFYATYGDTPPIKLKPMTQANRSAHALLGDDTNHDSMVKVMPK